MIDFDKPIQTRDGREVRIYAKDVFPAAYPIHGAIKTTSGWEVESWSNAGGVFNGEADARDLINVPTRREVWVNLYTTAPSEFWTQYATEEAANRASEPSWTRLGNRAHKIEWEE